MKKTVIRGDRRENSVMLRVSALPQALSVEHGKLVVGGVQYELMEDEEIGLHLGLPYETNVEGYLTLENNEVRVAVFQTDASVRVRRSLGVEQVAQRLRVLFRLFAGTVPAQAERLEDAWFEMFSIEEAPPEEQRGVRVEFDDPPQEA